MLDVRLLGRVEIAVAGSPLPPLRGKSGIWLLGILALNANRAIERDWVAGILWPESAPEQSRANLRRTLTDLRRALGIAACRLSSPSPQTLFFQLDEIEADVLAFRAGAFEHYGGDLMPGCLIEWVETERRVLVERFLGLGEKTAESLGPTEALALLERLRATDPLRESLLRQQLAILCHLGNRAEAQQIYHKFRRLLLESRLGEPSAQTQTHWRSMQSQPAEPAKVDHKSSSIPTPLTTLLGRKSESAKLGRLLEQHRLVTLTGLGGIGKTRLAIEVARAQHHALFLELAECRSSVHFAETLESELNLHDDGQSLLVVLDNFEQLVGPQANRALRAQLEKRPYVRCLITSRRVLGLTGEQLLSLHPLELPQFSGSPERLCEFESVQLLMERTRALRPSFEMTAQNSSAIVALCQQAEGIPLALELLAAHLRSLTPEALLAEVQRARLPLLARRDPAETPRHQSLWRIVESSLTFLTETQRAGFRQLGVFRGGWSLEAAQAVCATSGPIDAIALLEALEDSSLIRFRDGRYNQLETLREFAVATQLPELQTQDRRSHAFYFIVFAERHANTTAGLIPLDAEQHNLRAAFETLLVLGDTDSALRWTRAMRLYWYHRRGGQPVLEALLHQLHKAPERAELQENLAVLCAMNGSYDAAQRYFSEALDYFRQVGDVLCQAKILSNRAGMAIERGDPEEARLGLQEALPLWRNLNQPRGLGATLANLSIVTMEQGDLEAAQPLIEESLALRQAQGDSYGIATALISVGQLSLRRGASQNAEGSFRESLLRFQALGDRRGEAFSLEGLVETFLLQGRLTEALRFYREAEWLRHEYSLPETALQTQLYGRIRQNLEAVSNASLAAALPSAK